MGEGGGQIMVNATTWYFAAGGLYRTTNAGGSWTKVSDAGAYPTLYDLQLAHTTFRVRAAC